MISKTTIEKYCGEDISLIENYEQAVADTNQFWDCHHKLEIQKDKVLSRQELKDLGLYYNRPANELIFLKMSDHRKLHNKNIKEETKRKMSKSKKGNKHNFGKHLSDSQKKICGNAIRGKICYTNGVINVFREECPEGFWKGRTSTKKIS